MPTPHLPAEAVAALNKQKAIALPIGLLLAAVGWGFLVANRFFGFRQDKGPGPDHSGLLFTGLATFITIVAVIFVILRRKSVQTLLDRGRPTTATFLGVGGARKKGMVVALFSFTVDGVEHKVKKDILRSSVDAHESNPQVEIVYDPENPRRCYIPSR